MRARALRGEAGSAKNRPRGGSAGARSQSWSVGQVQPTQLRPLPGYDTRTRPFTRYEGRLRATGQNKSIGARATSGFGLS